MEIAKIDVSGAMAHVRYRNLVPAGLVGGYITVNYCDIRWEGLAKTVIFKGIETKDVITQSETVEIPAETVAIAGKRLMVGFFGTDADQNIVIPTLWADIGFIQPAADPSGDTSTDPTLPVYAQLAQQIGELREQIENIEPGGPGGTISATGQGDAIVIETSLFVKGDGDAIIIGGT